MNRTMTKKINKTIQPPGHDAKISEIAYYKAEVINQPIFLGIDFVYQSGVTEKIPLLVWPDTRIGDAFGQSRSLELASPGFFYSPVVFRKAIH